MSQIEWTDETWNPVVGCTRISAGCDHCYAVLMATRLQGSAVKRGKPIHYLNVIKDGDWSDVIARAPAGIFNKPLRTLKPTVYFVNSMSDMFHENTPDDAIMDAFKVMNACPHHTFQVLTKRPSRMVKKTVELGLKWSDNIWAGCSIEQDKFAAPRSRELLKVPAKLRFVSAEPLLGPLPSLDVADLDWVIAGGESGNATTVRPMAREWVRDLRDRCRAAGTPFFFKQWGAYGEDGERRSKGENGHLLDGEEIFEMPAQAYDRLITPDPRWTRIEKRTHRLAAIGLAAATPDQRLAGSVPRLLSDKGLLSVSLDDAVLMKMRGDINDLHEGGNPNKAEGLVTPPLSPKMARIIELEREMEAARRELLSEA